MKFCSRCNKNKDISEFHKDKSAKDGWCYRCKECAKQISKKWRTDNPDRNKENVYRWHKEHREKISIEKKIKYRDNPDRYKNTRDRWRKANLKKINIRKREYIISNIDKCRKTYSEYQKTRRASDPNYKLICNLRSRLNTAVKKNQKVGSAVLDLGCSIEELKCHLELQFCPGMSWDNYGEWHIDHIVPLSRVDLTDREQFKKVCHYTNLQPLWAIDNIEKRNKIESIKQVQTRVTLEISYLQ